MMRTTFTLALALSLTGCFALNDTERFETDEGCDLTLRVRDFTPHVRDTFTVRLVQDAPNGEGSPSLLAQAIFEPLVNPNVDLRMPDAIAPLTNPEQDRASLDFFADFDGSGGYSGPPDDHTWRVEDACINGPDLFVHNLDFANLPDPSKPALVDGSSNPEHLITRGSNLRILGCTGATFGTGALEARVRVTLPPLVEGGGERTPAVAYHRIGNVRDIDGVVTVPDMFDTGFRYDIELILDTNSNGSFEDAMDESFVYTFNGAVCPDQLLDEADCVRPGVMPIREDVPACVLDRDGHEFDGDIILTHSARFLANQQDPQEDSWISCDGPCD